MKRSLMSLGAALLSAVHLAVPASAQNASKDVTIVLGEGVDLMEPCMSTRSNIGRVLLQNINETLTEFDVVGDKGLMPRLAESWDQQNDSTWRFHLRKNVKFSDGSDFDAEDVKHSIDRAMSKDLSCETPRYFGSTKITATVVDPSTIDITAEPKQAILPLLMSIVTIVPSDTPMQFVRDPIGTGPYKMAAWNVGQNIVLERRGDYWGDAPQVEKATYVFRTDPAVAAAMVQTGEADIAPAISVTDATNAETDQAYPNSEVFYMRIDQGKPPLQDKRIREALNLAIDRQAFVGTLVPAETTLATAMVPPTTLGFNKDIKPWPFDAEKAKALIADAKADGVAVDSKITLIGRSNLFPNVLEVMEAIQSMLTDVGFNVDLQMYEVAEFEDIYGKPFAEDRTAQLVAAQHDNARGDPVFSMFFKYHSNGPQSGFSDPKVDQMIEDATAATGEDRAKKWSDLFAYLNNDVVADVLLFNQVSFARVNPRVTFKPTIATNSQLQLSQVGFK
ncbi:ABC transporter substrate-binding protein [Rhizobium sp. LCM 4573]|uniref:ABC transporter substrate-binding protein n=1 Tax=Rhizobium sp. LCM 4573 TaxID=1848291 RepID=UPI0008D90A56|nr:ABC transporter substrate-binding protein [Rhizobium sp. LCM 4573]OHV77050.1 peptide ABC transporter substrate-binding protein [Rhizobium sp. LCM 4573]